MIRKSGDAHLLRARTGVPYGSRVDGVPNDLVAQREVIYHARPDGHSLGNLDAARASFTKAT
jgi:hypothetical protein